MGQGHGAQGKALVGPVQNIAVESEIATDGEENPLRTPFFKPCQPASEGLTVSGSASLVKCNETPA